MANGFHFDRDDVTASAAAISGAAFGIIGTLPFSNSLYLLAFVGIVGSVIGQLLARHWLRGKRSEQRNEGPFAINSIRGVSIWAASCIAFAALLGYFSGKPMGALAQGTGIMALLVATALATTLVAKQLQRQRRDGPKRRA